MRTYTTLSFLLLMFFLMTSTTSLIAGEASHVFSKNLIGHRLTVTNIEIIKQKGKTAHIYADIVNTGRFDITTGKDKRLPYLTIEFDETLEKNGLKGYEESIIQKVKEAKMKIRIGEARNRLFMKVKFMKKITPLNQQPIVAATPEKKKETLMESIESQLDEPLASMETIIPSAKREAVAPAEKVVEESMPAKVEEMEKQVTIEEEAIVEMKKKNQKTIKKEKVSKRKLNKPKQEKKKKSKVDKSVVFESPTFESKSLEEILKEKEECPDLIIEGMEVIKVKSNKATVKFLVKNIGKGPARIYAKGNKEDDPVGVRAYISGSDRITKGSINIGGFFMEGGLDETKGYLNANESFEMEVVLDIKKKTRYMPNIVLSLDAFLKLRECDRTNNTSFAEIK